MAEANKGKVLAPLLQAFAPLHRIALGVALGVVLGVLIFLMTLNAVLRGGFPVPNLWLLREFFFGYTVTFGGAFVGLAWGFVVGFFLGWGFALLRNLVMWIWLTVIRSRAEMEQYGDFLDHL